MAEPRATSGDGDAKHIAHNRHRRIRTCLTFGVPSVAPAFRQFPTDSPSTMPPLFAAWTAFGLPSLAATSIASRTSFVVCVPIASATPPSLQGQAGFTHTLRVITALSVPHSVADGCAPTPSGSCNLRHGHQPRLELRLYLRYAPRPHVITSASAATPSAYPLVTCTHRIATYVHYAFPRRSPSAQVVLSKSKSSHRGVTRSVGGVRHPWVFVPHPTNGTPMAKNANRLRTSPPSRHFTVGKIFQAADLRRKS